MGNNSLDNPWNDSYWTSTKRNHKNITKFNISNLDKNRRRKNLVIQPNAVSKKINSIFFNKIEILFNLLLQVKTIHRQHAVQHFAAQVMCLANRTTRPQVQWRHLGQIKMFS